MVKCREVPANFGLFKALFNDVFLQGANASQLVDGMSVWLVHLGPPHVALGRFAHPDSWLACLLTCLLACLLLFIKEADRCATGAQVLLTETRAG
jgi:hypothetical protein